jgi:SAM-dependent methyltransferase
LESRDYWESRLERNPDLTGTGHRAFDARYNRWLYRAQREALEDALAQHRVDVEGRSVLDVGSGTGYWLEVLAERRPDRLVALELTGVAAGRLRERFPQVEVHQADVADPTPALTGPFHLVTAMSVLFHIVEDAPFERALANLARWLAPGGWLVVSGVFRQPRLPTAPHVRFRPLAAYREPLERGGLEVVELRPVLYLLQRTFVPVLGPALVCGLRLGALFHRVDRALARRRWPNGFGQKLLVARRPG